MEAQVQTKPLTTAELTTIVVALQESIAAMFAKFVELEKKLEDAKPRNSAEREMTDDDARRVLIGDCKDMKHKDAASKLGLSYGQIYSCRGEYTFKHISKEVKEKNAGWKNPWVK